jgi:hypothetical protein
MPRRKAALVAFTWEGRRRYPDGVPDEGARALATNSR